MFAVVDEESDEAVGLRGERGAGREGPRLLPQNQLAEGGGARGAAAVHPQNCEYSYCTVTVALCADRVGVKAHSHRASRPTLNVHTPILFPVFDTGMCDADGNAEAGKNRNLLDFIPGNVAVTLTLTCGVNRPFETSACTKCGLPHAFPMWNCV